MAFIIIGLAITALAAGAIAIQALFSHSTFKAEAQADIATAKSDLASLRTRVIALEAKATAAIKSL